MLAIYSRNKKSSGRQISRSIEATRFGFSVSQSLWSLTGASAAMLPRRLSNFKTIYTCQHRILRGLIIFRCLINTTLLQWPVRPQAIGSPNVDLLPIGPLETNCDEIRIKMQNTNSNKMRFKVSSAKWRPFCLGLDVIIMASGLSQDWPVSKIERRRQSCGR